MHTGNQLLKDLTALGIREGDTVLMHSSYKSLGGLEGGAKTFFEVMLELLGETGTMVVPALSYENVTRANPVFDRAASPSCVGYLSEYFRTSVPGVIRSMHATHSCCAIGRLACELIRDHEKDTTPVGENSPFAKLPRVDGKILMLGCTPRRNTMIHGVEETVKLPYGIDWDTPVHYTMIDGDVRIEQDAYRHQFHLPEGEIVQRYDKVIELLSEDEASHGRVLEADCYLMSARAAWDKARARLLEEPLFFVEHPVLGK